MDYAISLLCNALQGASQRKFLSYFSSDNKYLEELKQNNNSNVVYYDNCMCSYCKNIRQLRKQSIELRVKMKIKPNTRTNTKSNTNTIYKNYQNCGKRRRHRRRRRRGNQKQTK